jgi:hypothetical protein
MAVTLTVNGLRESPLLGSLAINDNINDRSSANFIIDTENSIEVGHEITIYDGATKIFAGSIITFRRIAPRGSTLKRYDVKCSDYNELCDRRLVAASYTAKTVTYVVEDIISTILAEEGVTAGIINGDGYTFVNVVFNYKTVSECLNQIKDNTGLNWNIDYDKKLNLFYRNDIAGDPFTDALANYIDIEVENDKESYRNVQYLRAGYDKTPTITKEKVAPKPDGISRKFRLRFPIAEVPTIYVNDVAISNSDMGINGIQDDKKWYWSKGEKDIIQDDSETVLSDSDTLTVTYKGLRRIIVKSENVQQQNERKGNGLGSGVYEDIDIAAMINDKNQAMDFAKGMLGKYADIPQKVRILTQDYRRAGQIIQITSRKVGIDGEYLIESVDISEESGEFFYEVKALSGEALGSWTEYFRKLKGKYNEFIETENEYLIVALDPQEAIGITGSNEMDITYALYPSVALLPSETLYPNGGYGFDVEYSNVESTSPDGATPAWTKLEYGMWQGISTSPSGYLSMYVNSLNSGASEYVKFYRNESSISASKTKYMELCGKLSSGTAYSYLELEIADGAKQGLVHVQQNGTVYYLRYNGSYTYISTISSITSDFTIALRLNNSNGLTVYVNGSSIGTIAYSDLYSSTDKRFLFGVGEPVHSNIDFYVKYVVYAKEYGTYYNVIETEND